MNDTLHSKNQAKKLSVMGWCLIALAFSIPFVSIAMGHSSAGRAGYDLGQMLPALAVLVFITYLVLRGRSALVHSYVRVVVGVLMTLWALESAGQKWHEVRKQKAFIIEVQEMQARQSSRFAEIEKRFNSVTFETVLTPEAIISPGRISAGRQIISKYLALLGERQNLLTDV